MPSVTLDRLKQDLHDIYLPPAGAVATYRKIRQVINEFEIHAKCKLASDLTAPAVSKWLQKFPDRKPVTTFTLLSSLRRACNYAQKNGWLRVTPFEVRKLNDWVRDYDPGDDEEAKERHHSIEDLRKVLALLKVRSLRSWEGHRLFALACATLYTGARAREVQCSEVKDWDLNEGLFYIRKNERRTLKTQKSKRVVELPGELIDVMSAWVPKTDSDWAFPGARRFTPWEGGGPGRKPLDQLKAIGSELGIHGMTFLSCRHSYVTHSAAFGIPELLTQELCGHTKRETTKRYRGKDRDNRKQAVNRVTFGLSVFEPMGGEEHGKEVRQTARRA